MAGIVDKNKQNVIIILLAMVLSALVAVGALIAITRIDGDLVEPSEKVSLVEKCEKLCGRRGVHKFVRACYPGIQSGSITCECMPVEEENR